MPAARTLTAVDCLGFLTTCQHCGRRWVAVQWPAPQAMICMSRVGALAFAGSAAQCGTCGGALAIEFLGYAVITERLHLIRVECINDGCFGASPNGSVLCAN